MAKTTRTCPVCNEAEIAYSARNRKEVERYADWKIAQGDMCADCRKKQQQEEAAKAAEKNAAEGLPELQGTPKQIAWAESIRAQIIGHLDEIRAAMLDVEAGDKEAARARINALPYHFQIATGDKANPSHRDEVIALCDLVQSKVDAGWWIDARTFGIREMHDDLKGEMATPVTTPAPIDESDVADEIAVKPATPITPTVAEITVQPDRVIVALPERNDTFRALVKGLGYRWNPDKRRWFLSMSVITGDAEDRAAELMHRLLGAGFTVACHRAAVREKALAASYEPVYPRWISYMKGEKLAGFLRLSFDSALEIEATIRRMHGRPDYHAENVWYVRPSHYAMIRDIAETHGFRVTEGAEQELSAAQHKDEARLLAKDLPEAPKSKPAEAPERATPIGVDESLRDD